MSGRKGSKKGSRPVARRPETRSTTRGRQPRTPTPEPTPTPTPSPPPTPPPPPPPPVAPAPLLGKGSFSSRVRNAGLRRGSNIHRSAIRPGRRPPPGTGVKTPRQPEPEPEPEPEVPDPDPEVPEEPGPKEPGPKEPGPKEPGPKEPGPKEPGSKEKLPTIPPNVPTGTPWDPNRTWRPSGTNFRTGAVPPTLRERPSAASRLRLLGIRHPHVREQDAPTSETQATSTRTIPETPGTTPATQSQKLSPGTDPASPENETGSTPPTKTRPSAPEETKSKTTGNNQSNTTGNNQSGSDDRAASSIWGSQKNDQRVRMSRDNNNTPGRESESRSGRGSSTTKATETQDQSGRFTYPRDSDRSVINSLPNGFSTIPNRVAYGHCGLTAAADSIAAQVTPPPGVTLPSATDLYQEWLVVRASGTFDWALNHLEDARYQRDNPLAGPEMWEMIYRTVHHWANRNNLPIRIGVVSLDNVGVNNRPSQNPRYRGFPGDIDLVLPGAQMVWMHLDRAAASVAARKTYRNGETPSGHYTGIRPNPPPEEPASGSPPKSLKRKAPE